MATPSSTSSASTRARPNPSLRSNSDSFRSTASTMSTANSSTASSSSSSRSNHLPILNPNGTPRTTTTTTTKRASHLHLQSNPNLNSTPRSSATSSIGRASVQSGLTPRNTTTTTTSHSRSNTNSNNNGLVQPRSRFNSVASTHSQNSVTSNSNPFTPSGRKLINNPTSMSNTNNTTQRIKMQHDRALANANIRNSPSKNNGLSSKSVSSKNLATKNKAANGKAWDAWTDNEPIKAFLRVRPASADGRKEHLDQHLEVISETEVILSPSEAYLKATGRATAPSKYSFTKVFSSDHPSSGVSDPNSQASFFKSTTLPMIKDLLDGRSGLICTYGVTNSGKSYTVQGERGDGKEGILPRAIDTVFNSIQGLESESEIRPTGLYGVERYSPEESPIETSGGSQTFSLQSLIGRLTSTISPSKISSPQDSTTLQVDRNRRYSIWVSYVELYNEKFYDLLDVGTESTASNSKPGGGMTRSATSNWSLAGKNPSTSDSQQGGGSNGLLLNRKALKLVLDQESQAFYLGGTKEIRVKTASEAQELVRKGQQNRAVFSTLANRVSSRSHGIFTIKVITEHGSGSSNPDESIGLSCSTSRLTIVDLAGTERASNTGTTSTTVNNGISDQEGRLNEAKSINRSLFGLGNCLQVLRENQNLAFNSINSSNNNDGLTTNKKVNKPSVVPFRSSQLTKMLQPFLTGNEAGRAVFILNLNPWDTGFNENTESLKFSTTAQEVKVNTGVVHKNQLLASPSKRERLNSTSNSNGSSSASDGISASSIRGKKSSSDKEKQVRNEKESFHSLEEINEGDVTIIEVSDSDEEDDEEDESNPFVDYLLRQHEELRQQLFDAQMRCAKIESQVRAEMATEMDEQLQAMERLYNERALNDAEQHELLANRKLDLLSKFNQSQLTPKANSRGLEIESDEEAREEEEDEDEEEIESDLLALPSSPLRLSDLVVNGASHLTSPSEVVGKRHPLASSSSDSPADSSERILRPGRTDATDKALSKRITRHSTEGEDSFGEESEDDQEEDDISEDSQDGGRSQESGSEPSDSESEQTQEEEEEEELDSSDDHQNEEEQVDAMPQAVRKSTRSTRSRTLPSSTSSNLEEAEMSTRSRPTRKAAVVANAKNTNPNASSTKEKETRGRSVKALKERIQVEDDPSDTSLLVEPTKEKKKRVLRSKKAVDEEAMLDSIADSSLVAAVKKSNSSKRIASNNQRLR